MSQCINRQWNEYNITLTDECNTCINALIEHEMNATIHHIDVDNTATLNHQAIATTHQYIRRFRHQCNDAMFNTRIDPTMHESANATNTNVDIRSNTCHNRNCKHYRNIHRNNQITCDACNRIKTPSVTAQAVCDRMCAIGPDKERNY